MDTRAAQPELLCANTSPERQLNRLISLVRMASDRQRELVEAIGRLQSSSPPPFSVEVPPLELPVSEVTKTQPAPSLFDELVTAVSNGSLEVVRQRGALPPPARFRVRTVPVGRPHRATKRNYDYFEELNARIANGEVGELRGIG